MNAETRPSQQTQTPIAEILKKHYKYLVVDPYAVNLIDNGPRIGQARLSFYSAFALNAAGELLDAEITDNVIVFSDATFGKNTKTTAELMYLRLRKPRRGKTPLEIKNITMLNDGTLNNTASQVSKLSRFLNNRHIDPTQILYLAWDYHHERIKNHLQGYGIGDVEIVSAAKTHKYFRPQFDGLKMEEVLPLEEIEKIEAPRRKLSAIDKLGIAPRLIRSILKEGYVLDNQRGEDGLLHLYYEPGKQRLKEVSAL